MTILGNFRPGQWVVLAGTVGIIFKRKERVMDGNGILTGDPDVVHYDFHPVKDDGTTDTANIVLDAFVDGLPVDDSMRQATVDEIPDARRPSDEVAARFGYENG
jgi:hypothetical protein